MESKNAQASNIQELVNGLVHQRDQYYKAIDKIDETLKSVETVLHRGGGSVIEGYEGDTHPASRVAKDKKTNGVRLARPTKWGQVGGRTTREPVIHRGRAAPVKKPAEKPAKKPAKKRVRGEWASKIRDLLSGGQKLTSRQISDALGKRDISGQLYMMLQYGKLEIDRSKSPFRFWMMKDAPKPAPKTGKKSIVTK